MKETVDLLKPFIPLVQSLFWPIFIGAIFFRYCFKCLPGKEWIKGLVFGLIIGIIKSVPEAFNQFMTINYPAPLIMEQLFNTY